jgi:hypothetical protein
MPLLPLRNVLIREEKRLKTIWAYFIVAGQENRGRDSIHHVRSLLFPERAFMRGQNILLQEYALTSIFLFRYT